jgi:hypothetical protein
MVYNESDSEAATNWIEASMEQVCVPLPPWAIRAGARETIYFDPKATTAAIVTCGAPPCAGPVPRDTSRPEAGGPFTTATQHSGNSTQDFSNLDLAGLHAWHTPSLRPSPDDTPAATRVQPPDSTLRPQCPRQPPPDSSDALNSRTPRDSSPPGTPQVACAPA